jgi:hypothetical protein
MERKIRRAKEKKRERDKNINAWKTIETERDIGKNKKNEQKKRNIKE